MQIQDYEIKSQAIDENGQQYNRQRRQKNQNQMEQEIQNRSNQSGNSQTHDDKNFHVKKIQDQFNFLGNSGTISLDNAILNILVKYCTDQEIISYQTAHIYYNNHTITLDRKYVELFYKNRLHQYDFHKARINIGHQRQLVQLLLKQKPHKYKILSLPYRPFDYDRSVRQFLEDMWNKTQIYYYTIIEKQIIDYYQSWWGGPQRMRSIIDPPVKFYQSEQGKKSRQAKENTIRIQTNQQQKDRNKRVNTHKSLNDDLVKIAQTMISKLYANSAINSNIKQVKKQNIEDKSSLNDDSSVSNASKTKRSKNQKVKKQQGTKDKKKKSKSKSKKKKDKKEKSSKAKYQAKRQHKE